MLACGSTKRFRRFDCACHFAGRRTEIKPGLPFSDRDIVMLNGQQLTLALTLSPLKPQTDLRLLVVLDDLQLIEGQQGRHLKIARATRSTRHADPAQRQRPAQPRRAGLPRGEGPLEGAW